VAGRLSPRTGRSGGPTIRLWPPTQSAKAGLAGLPRFDEHAFRQRLALLYERVCAAWREQRLGDLEADVTLDLLASWTAAVAAAPAPLLVPIRDVTARIAEAGARGGHERVTVSLDGGQDDMGVERLQYWTLERRSRGTPAWVLARVESAADWTARLIATGYETESALAAIAAADPGFHPDVFADRVMAMYPRLMLAIREPRSALARVAMAQALRERLLRAQAGAGLIAWRAATSSTGVTGAAISYAIHWSRGDAVTVDLARVSAPAVDRWTFARPPGVRTSASGGVLAECCAVCAARIDIDDAGRCGHCATEITLGTRDWTLTAIRPWPALPPHLPDVLDGTVVPIDETPA
jgi:predicted lipid-binding transport protein (Tim44 family)